MLRHGGGITKSDIKSSGWGNKKNINHIIS